MANDGLVQQANNLSIISLFSHNSAISYVCSCGELKPISRIYFCRHCSKIRCGFCVCHEVDARYCSTCMENLPATEAWTKKNCCSNCFSCPVCHHNLTIRVTTVQTKKTDVPGTDKDEKKPDKPEPPKKFYYLSCFFCHWTTRDVGITDQTSSSGGWPDAENPHSPRFSSLLEYWKAVSVTDRMLKEKKQPSTRRGYTHLSGMSAAMTRRKAGLPMTGGPFGLNALQDIRKPPAVKAAIATAVANDLPETIFTHPPDLTKITTLDQRHSIPDLQCQFVSDLRPSHKLLLTKRSQRCRECEHNVTKPEYNPGSIKFKIQLSAYYHIPDIHIRSCEVLQAGADAFLVLKFINPTPNQTTINFHPLTEEDMKNKSDQDGTEPEETVSQVSQPPSLVTKRTPFTRVAPRPLKASLNATAVVPSCAVVLPGRDDAAEYDDTAESHNFNDDTKVVVWRKANKAAVKMAVRPAADLPAGTEVVMGLVMTHTYTNTIIQQKDQQNILHRVRLVLKLGKTQS